MLFHLSRSPKRLLILVCLAEVVSMVSFAAWPLFLVKLQPLWGLTNLKTGWVTGAYFVGYILATPILVGLTDRIDAKRIYIFSSLISFLGALLFAFFANGFWVAALCWGVVGAGLAGTYMPGLQILNARLDAKSRISLLPYYTSSFGIGTGISFLLNGWLYSNSHWQTAFIISAVASFCATLIIFLTVYPKAPVINTTTKRHPLDLRPAFYNKKALNYILAYCGHNYELFAYRGWLFAYLVFIITIYPTDWTAQTLSIIISIFAFIGMTASVIGAHYCLKLGRVQLIRYFGLLSLLTAVMFGFSGFTNLYIVMGMALIYNITIMLDSAALTAGTVSESNDHDRGALLAVHSMIGFSGGALGAPAVGFVLDITGGQTVLSWASAVSTMGLGSLVVFIIMMRFHIGNKKTQLT